MTVCTQVSKGPNGLSDVYCVHLWTSDMVNNPLVIVAKTVEDDQRNQANKIDAKG